MLINQLFVKPSSSNKEYYYTEDPESKKKEVVNHPRSKIYTGNQTSSNIGESSLNRKRKYSPRPSEANQHSQKRSKPSGQGAISEKNAFSLQPIVNLAAKKFLFKIKRERNALITDTSQRAQEVLNAIKIGQEVRDRIVLPSQIFESIKSYFKGSVSEGFLESIAKVICREVNELTMDPKIIEKGGSWRLKRSHLKDHLFPVLSDIHQVTPLSQKEPLKKNLKCDCWIEILPGGKELRLLLFPLEVNPLGRGAYKEVFRAHHLEISLEAKRGASLIYGRKASINTNVIQRVNKQAEAFDLANSLNVILASLEIHRFILEKFKGEDVKITSLPVQRLNTTSDDELELRQDWYNTDLHVASKFKKIPLSLFKDKTEGDNFVPIHLKGYLKVVLDISKTLEAFHKKGIVHRDVKNTNILIKIDSNNNPRGYLSDFDLTDPILTDRSKSKTYIYWDYLSKSGYVIPFVDCYGLAVSIGEVILGGHDIFSCISVNPEDFSKDSNVKSILKEKAFSKLCKDEIKMNNLQGDEIKIIENVVMLGIKNDSTRLTDDIKENVDSFSPKIKEIISNLPKKMTAVSKLCNIVVNVVRNYYEVCRAFKKLLETDKDKFNRIFAFCDIDEDEKMLAKVQEYNLVLNSVPWSKISEIRKELEEINTLLDS